MITVLRKFVTPSFAVARIMPPFDSYLNSCQVLDGVSSVDELEERMENQLIASVDYQHAGVKYSAQYVPLSVNNWYAVTTMPMDSFGSNGRCG